LGDGLPTLLPFRLLVRADFASKCSNTRCVASRWSVTRACRRGPSSADQAARGGVGTHASAGRYDVDAAAYSLPMSSATNKDFEWEESREAVTQVKDLLLSSR